MLLFLNIYSANMTRNLIFRSKESSLQGKTQLIVSSLSGLETMNADNVGQVISLLGDLGATRVVVTDSSGRALYDSLAKANAAGKIVLFPEIASAMEGNRVFHSAYDAGALESRACMPIMSYSQPVGAVYLMEYDTEQGAIIEALEGNILRISLVYGVIILLFSLVFSTTFSRRVRLILQSIQMLREGEYTHKIDMNGHDEFRILSEEFNKLTDRLQASEQMQRQFVSDASHELKTPLASIKLLADSILQNEMEMDTIREFVGDIGTEADRLTRIAQKLLELSRVNDAPKEDFVVMEPGPVVEKVIRRLMPMAELRGIQMISKLELGCTVVTREDDIFQIVFNLVENGIKYNMDNGRLLVQLRRVEDDVVLVVEDSGVGIPEDSIPYIFDRFYRVDKARSREAGGSGLGLSIVHDLVEGNYGTVSVERLEAGGTRFTVIFPYFGLEDEST